MAVFQPILNLSLHIVTIEFWGIICLPRWGAGLEVTILFSD